jgi:hypothetical protein
MDVDGAPQHTVIGAMIETPLGVLNAKEVCFCGEQVSVSIQRHATRIAAKSRISCHCNSIIRCTGNSLITS